MAEAADDGMLNLCEIAFEIEYRAYELYPLALEHRDKDGERNFLSLAQQEKAHVRALAKRIPDCL